MQGGDAATIGALTRGDISAAPLNDSERALLQFVELVTRHAYKTTAQDVERLREAGWRDEQIAEAVYITALFAFFNRVADAFGLEDPRYLQRLAGAPPPPNFPASGPAASKT